MAVIPLSDQITQVFYNHKPVLISRENSKRYAVFGIPLSAPVGILSLEKNIAPIQIEINAFSYAEQRL
ncbi:MAG: M23 family peptidase, partial [Acinetobacter junii]